jgi:hypothetical protein
MKIEREVLTKNEGVHGRYANYLEIGHNGYEFVLDFGQYYSGDKKNKFHTRIITSPKCAKDLLDILKRSIEQYENSYGNIEESLRDKMSKKTL